VGVKRVRKSRSHLKRLCAKSVTRGKFHNEGSNMLDA